MNLNTECHREREIRGRMLKLVSEISNDLYTNALQFHGELSGIVPCKSLKRRIKAGEYLDSLWDSVNRLVNGTRIFRGNMEIKNPIKDKLMVELRQLMGDEPTKNG